MRLLAFLLVIVAIGSLGYSFYMADVHHQRIDDFKELGPRGDFIGGYIGTGAAVAGPLLFLAALMYQSKELNTQQQELVLSRRVFENQHSAMQRQILELEEQNEQLKQQNVITQRRDDITLLLALIEKAGDLTGSGWSNNRTMVLHCLKMIAHRGAMGAQFGNELLSFFVATVTRGFGNEGYKRFVESMRPALTYAIIDAREWIKVGPARDRTRRARSINTFESCVEHILTHRGEIPHDTAAEGDS